METRFEIIGILENDGPCDLPPAFVPLFKLEFGAKPQTENSTLVIEQQLIIRTWGRVDLYDTSSDEGRPLGAALQEEASPLKLYW